MPKGGRVYKQVFLQQVSRGLRRNQSKVKKATYNEALKFHRRKKRRYLREFNQHPVTREIERGPNARANISNTLPGLSYEGGGGGNLFSFIGFHSTDRPIDAVRLAIQTGTVLMKTPTSITKRITGSDIRFRVKYKILFPGILDLGRLTPMPWEPGSWLKKIETGISGLGYYIFSRKGSGRSRSGTGIQAYNTLRGTSFSPKPYMRAIIGKVWI